MRNLRYADSNGTRLIKDYRIDIGKVFNIIAAFNKDPLLSRYPDGC